MLHAMWDIETCDTAPSAIVVSIGVVLFNPNSDYIDPSNRFYAIPGRFEQAEAGRTSSMSTMAWWENQSAAAKAVFDVPARPVRDVLEDLSYFMQHQSLPIEGIWGNGSDFDNVIIADLYRSFGMPAPWQFWKNRCHRTLKALKTPIEYIKPVRQGVHHNALDDALHQAREAQAIIRALGLSV